MKKLFLTSGLVLCMACPAFATTDIGSGTTGSLTSGCTETYLDAYSGDVSFEAKWNADSYNVVYQPGAHGSCGQSCTGVTYTGGVTYDSDYTLLAPTALTTQITANTGYTFAGWNDGTATRATGYTYSPYQTDGALTLTAQWTANTNHISYATGTAGSRTTGFSGTMADTDAVYDSSVTLRTNAFSIPGYEFAGWTSTKNLASGATANSSYTDGQTINPYKLDADVQLTATWTAKTFTVTYDKGAHAASGVNNYTDTNGATYDANYTARSFSDATNNGGAGMSAADGYTFAGWTTDSTPTFTQNVLNNAWTGETPWTRTAALTVYAAYTANGYTISYNCGSALAGSQSTNTGTVPATQNVSMDGGYTLAANTCVMNGYTFNGWSCPNLPGTPTLPADAQTKTYFAGGATGTYSYAGNITCTAQWKQNTINLSWLPNGGSVDGAGQTAYSQSNTCQYDGAVTIPPAPKRNGYRFDGWTVVQQSGN